MRTPINKKGGRTAPFSKNRAPLADSRRPESTLGSVSISPGSIPARLQVMKAPVLAWSPALAALVLRAIGPACWTPHPAGAPIGRAASR